MDDPVEDGISNGFVTNHLMPFGNGYLRCDDRGLLAESVFYDVHESGSVLSVERLKWKRRPN